MQWINRNERDIPLIQKSIEHEDIADDNEIEWKVFTKLRLILMINPNDMYIYVDILDMSYEAKFRHVKISCNVHSYSCYRLFTSIEYQTLLAILY